MKLPAGIEESAFIDTVMVLRAQRTAEVSEMVAVTRMGGFPGHIVLNAVFQSLASP